ncbi:MAG: lysophospholipid acyltransferase family protein [Armatimonadota bacterium]
MKKHKHELSSRIGSFLAWVLVQIIGHTTKFHLTGDDRFHEYLASGKGLIIAIWHGRTMLPVYYHRGLGVWTITSLSRDGELQTGIVNRFGFRAVRGSTGRGGMKAALTISKKLAEGGVFAITPDGPRGPIYEVQDGVIFLSRHAGCPIIPVGVGLSKRKLAKSWDRYALPYPFGRCEMVFGEPILPPKDDSEEQNSAVKEKLKVALLDVQQKAQIAAGEGEL